MRNIFLTSNCGRVSLKKNSVNQYVLRFIIWPMQTYPKVTTEVIHATYPAEEYAGARIRAYSLYEKLLQQTIAEVKATLASGH